MKQLLFLFTFSLCAMDYNTAMDGTEAEVSDISPVQMYTPPTNTPEETPTWELVFDIEIDNKQIKVDKLKKAFDKLNTTSLKEIRSTGQDKSKQ